MLLSYGIASCLVCGRTMLLKYWTASCLVSSHEHGVLSELLWSLTVCRCPSIRPTSVHKLLVNTLASTNINQSSPNLVKMYMTTRTQMSSIMEPIVPELSELSALEFENLPYLTVYSLASANIDQSVPNLAKIHMPMRARMSSIMGKIEPEHLELFALEFGKIAESDFVYTLASTNIDQSAPNLLKMYMTIRSWMSLIMDLIGPELSELSALEFENFPYLTLFTR